MAFLCNECGKTFNKKKIPKTLEVQCPKCKSTDTEIAPIKLNIQVD